MTKGDFSELLSRCQAVIGCYERFRRATPMDDDFRELLEDVDGAVLLLKAYTKGVPCKRSK